MLSSFFRVILIVTLPSKLSIGGESLLRLILTSLTFGKDNTFWAITSANFSIREKLAEVIWSLTVLITWQ